MAANDGKVNGMRGLLIVANWKMHKTVAEAEAFLEAFLPEVGGLEGVEVALAPPFTALAAVAPRLRGSGVKLAAQNMHFAPQGAYTGEISPLMLKELGCRYVILGHSERRGHFGEDDGLINRKLHAAFEYGLIPILCVGETLEERRRGETNSILERQLRAALEGVSQDRAGELVIAYEPVWAIGTGETASPEDAEAGARFLRSLVAKLYDEQTAQRIRVQYGGSVKPENIKALVSQPDVDGALVGGASLDPGQFARIVKGAASVA